jgi:hypothetical protein
MLATALVSFGTRQSAITTYSIKWHATWDLISGHTSLLPIQAKTDETPLTTFGATIPALTFPETDPATTQRDEESDEGRSVWRVSKPDHPVFTPAWLVEFGTNWIQLPPWGSQHDPILRNALANESLFDPIGAPV